MGYGVIRVERAGPVPVTYGCIETKSTQPVPERLLTIYHAVESLLDEHKPVALSLEKLFFTKNITSAMSVSEVRGIILLAAAQRQVPVIEYTPNQVKQAITGSGRADKVQVQQMITRLLGLPAVPKPDDTADALAIALCHIHILR